MKFKLLTRSAIWFLLSACSALLLNAAEIHLQGEAQCSGSLVRLGELATINGADTLLCQRLAEVELFPAPATNGYLDLDQRHLLELLEIRGFDPLELSVTGAARSRVYGPSTVTVNRQPEVLPAMAADSPPRPIVAPWSEPVRNTSAAVADPQTLAAAEGRLTQAVVDYLRRMAGGNYSWNVSPQVPAADAALFTSGGLEISGGKQPWTGRQALLVRVHQADGIQQRTLQVEVSLPERVVAASRSLSAGEVIQASDLQLVVPTAAAAGRKTIGQLDEVVGMEAVRNIVAGQPLEVEMIRQPILVQRNGVAQLSVRAGGVVVGTKVRALDDGTQGQQIRVQSLFDRQQYTVTVTGPQQVEMLAGSGGS